MVLLASFTGFFFGALVGGALYLVAVFVARLFGVDPYEFYSAVPPYWFMGACFLIWVFGVVGASRESMFESGRAAGWNEFGQWQEEERKWQELKRQKPE